MPSSLVWYKCVSRLIVSNSLWSQGLWPMRFLCPWNFPGKNTGVGCYFLLQRILPDPGIEPGSPALQADSLPCEPLGKIVKIYKRINVQHAHQTYFCCLVDQSCLFCNPVDCCLPGSSVHVISQARILEWLPFPFSRGSLWPRNWTLMSCIADDSLPQSHQGISQSVSRNNSLSLVFWKGLNNKDLNIFTYLKKYVV